MADLTDYHAHQGPSAVEYRSLEDPRALRRPWDSLAWNTLARPVVANVLLARSPAGWRLALAQICAGSDVGQGWVNLVAALPRPRGRSG